MSSGSPLQASAALALVPQVGHRPLQGELFGSIYFIQKIEALLEAPSAYVYILSQNSAQRVIPAMWSLLPQKKRKRFFF